MCDCLNLGVIIASYPVSTAKKVETGNEARLLLTQACVVMNTSKA